MISIWRRTAGTKSVTSRSEQSAKSENWISTMVLIQFTLFALCSLLLVTLFVPAVRRHIDIIAGTAAAGAAIASVTRGLSGALPGQCVDAWRGRLARHL